MFAARVRGAFFPLKSLVTTTNISNVLGKTSSIRFKQNRLACLDLHLNLIAVKTVIDTLVAPNILFIDNSCYLQLTFCSLGSKLHLKPDSNTH